MICLAARVSRMIIRMKSQCENEPNGGQAIEGQHTSTKKYECEDVPQPPSPQIVMDILSAMGGGDNSPLASTLTINVLVSPQRSRDSCQGDDGSTRCDIYPTLCSGCCGAMWHDSRTQTDVSGI